MTPREFQVIQKAQLKIIDDAESIMSQAELEARDCPLPNNLRPAEPKDIIEGAIIWYKHGDDGHFWQIVEEVMRPNDPFKAYCSFDGCRYGLDDGWIEI